MANPADGDGASFVAQNETPDYVIDQPVQPANPIQQPRLNLTKMELGEAIRDGRIRNALSGQTVEGVPAPIALRWEYSNGQVGAQWSCLFEPQDGSDEILKTFANEYASGAAWCSAELPSAGSFKVSTLLGGQQFWSGTITVNAKQEEAAPRPKAARPSPTPSPLPTAEPIVEKVNCVLPDGSQLQLDLSSCRERNGLVLD
jgi:hypothetical protein